MNKDPAKRPAAYFITFTTYCTWLHGNEKTSVHVKNNQFLTPKIKHHPLLLQSMQKKLKHHPFILTSSDRKIVLQQLIETCDFCQWELYAAHVRTNHVHIVIEAADFAEHMMTKIKAYASRRLNKIYGDTIKKFWSRHGSTRYIWSREFLFPAMKYVIEEQGKKMACFHQPWYSELLKHENWDY